MNPTQEEKYKILRRLPEEIQDAITSVESPAINQAIGTRYTLSQEKIGALAEDIGLTLLGLAPAIDFVENLRKHLLISVQQAEKIAQEIQRQTFAPIQESLVKLHGLSVWDIGMGPQAVPQNQKPLSIWSSVVRKRENKIISILDRMSKNRAGGGTPAATPPPVATP